MKRIVFLFALFQATTGMAQEKPYFQQQVNYIIHVSLDDVAHMLRGQESFEYVNNSQESLDFLYIHLWPNAYKNKQTALARQLARSRDYFLWYALDDDKGFIDSLDFRVNGVQASWELTENIDIAILHLPQPLAPGARVNIATPFRVKIPSGSISRLGHVGQSYQVTQWYPKPAVYDRNGWHPLPYLTQGEFYSEFGSFEVSISLPANYTVGATGDLENDNEGDRLDSLAAVSASREPQPGSNDFPPSSPYTKTLHYSARNVHDFGWFADKRFEVLKGEVILPNSGRSVTTWALFTPANAEYWKKASAYLHDAIYYYSLWNGEYPYNQVTAVDGTISAGGGMEYPNVTVIGNANSDEMLDLVITHEVGHNWFYGILGSNERDNAWMDEGINSFYEDRYMQTKYPDLDLADVSGLGVAGEVLGLDQFPYKSASMLEYMITATINKDQSLGLTSDDYTSINYGAMVYKKTAIVFQYLRAYLGDQLFDQCMHVYFDRWKYKHPSPQDVEDVFEQTTGKNLDWVFHDLITTTEKVDYAVRRVHRSESGYDLKVVNRGEVASPFSITEMREGRVLNTTWFDGFEPLGSGTVTIRGLDADALRIDGLGDMTEINRKNNTIRTSGLFRTSEPLEVRLLSYIRKDDKSQVFWMPVVAWNEYNTWMPGLWIHNITVPLKSLEWSATPLYSFATSNLNGFASVGYYGKGIDFVVHGSKFNTARHENALYEYRSIYTRVAPRLTIHLMPSAQKVNHQPKLDARLEYIHLSGRTTTTELTDDYFESVLKKENDFIRLGIDFQKRWISSLSLSETVEATFGNGVDLFDGTPLLRSSTVVGYMFNKKKKRSAEVVFFAAASENIPIGINGISGGNDVLADYLYLGRSEDEGLLSNQFVRSQGALGIPTRAATSDWMISATFSCDLPVKLPIALYGGVALVPKSDQGTSIIGTPMPIFSDSDYGGMYTNLGFKFPIVREVFEIYMPLVYSQKIQREFEFRDLNFGDRIQFELNLHLLSPSRIIRQSILK